jgi:putative restriction endonuclease
VVVEPPGPPLSKSDLIDRVLLSARTDGWQVLFLTNEHPFNLILAKDDASHRATVYVWNLSGGGRANLPNEYRIQITAAPPPRQGPPGSTTLILGWFEQLGVIAGFDPVAHRDQPDGSQSVQISRHSLDLAVTGQLAVEERAPGELAVAFPTRLLVPYIERLHDIHGMAEVDEIQALGAAGAGEEPAAGLVVGPRAQILQNVIRWVRDATFRTRVLAAYDHACTICGLQMGLVQGAHIIPVPIPGGTDETSNGLALCALHHAAYDRGLLGVGPDLRVVANNARVAAAASEGIGVGADALTAYVGQAIRLPAHPPSRPNPDYLRRGLELRGWPA